MTAVDATLPLSTAQTDVWFDEQLSGGGLAYAMADYLDIRGPLDTTVFEAALHRLAEEAECFRARFFEVAGEPRQVIEPLPELPVRYPDLTGEADPVTAAVAWMHEDLRKPFALTDFPLFRGALLELGPRRHFWYLTTHHLVGDGYSAAICHRRLGELYNALLAGESVEDGRLPFFRHLLEADLAYQDSTHRVRDKEFWSGHFESTPDLVSLSGAEPAPARGFLRRSLVLPGRTASAVRAAVAAAKVTLPTFVIAAMGAYTQRVSGLTELLLTVPVAARAGVRSRATPGMVANYLPLRMVVEPDMTPGELLARSSRELARTLKHQRYHVNQIRRDIGVRSDERRPFGGPFVNVLPPDPGLRLGECETRLNNLSTGITNDLSVTVLDAVDGGIELHLNGNPDLYDGPGVQAHLDRFAAFLERFALADPNGFLGRVDVLTEDEAGAALALGVGAPGTVDADLLTRLRAVAEATPDAVAVVDDGGAVTYSALLGRASALSRRLPGGLAGVLAEPGIGFVTAVLGVLGSGGAYVPLDPSMPVARLTGLLADSGAAALLAGPGHEELAARIAGESPLVRLDDAEDPADSWAPVSGAQDDLAYVIFTSGSTGKPKGAMVHRRGMVNHLLAKVEDLGLRATDIVVQNAPLTFDVSVWQMLAPLLVGAQVRVVDRATAADPDALFGLIPGEGVSVLEVVPSLLRAALDAWDIAGDAVALPGLRWLVVTGEALPPDLSARWFARFPEIPLVNAYGPTECSDDVTHAVLRSGEAGARVPIGRPVRNCRLYVLGDELRPVPVGAMGELYVGGLVVGRGYVNAPERTASVFVADPFGEPGARMYRTGDRVVSRPDGSLEFVERRDFQVKIRGHRIELGEIESTLRSLPEVADAVVRVLTDPAGTTRLAAYLTSAGTGALDAAAVRSTLQQLLPDYMVPSAMFALDRLPLTEHGKVDRDALPEPDFGAELVGRAPRDAAEQLLCDVLAEVLTVPRVYIDDNFFALGGDSISAIQVVSRARRAGLVITPRDILENRTPAAIAVGATLSGAAAEFVAPEGPLVEVPADELAELSAEGTTVEDVLPLSPLQQGLLFHSEFDPDGVDVYTVQAVANLEGPLDVAAVRAACAALLHRHATLRAYFRHLRTGEAVQVIAAGVGLPWTELDLSHLPAPERDAELRRILDEDRASRFDLARPPLVRFTLITMAAGEFRFLWTAHHIATDGWSVPILIRELSELYQHGPAAGLPAVTPFRDYLAWLAGQDQVAARRAWRTVLAGLAEPTRIAPPAAEPARSLPASAELALSESDTARLSAWARGHELTLNTLVQACWAILVGRLAGQRDVVFGSVTSGRPAELPGVETMVGMFVNTVPVRARLDPARPVAELLAELRRQQSAMLSSQHVGLAEVQNEVPGLAGVGELFDTAVVFENVPADDQGPRVTLGEHVRVVDAVTLDSRHYPLSLVVEPGRRLLFRFDYATELFAPAEIELLTRRFSALLDAVTTDPATLLGRVDVVTRDEHDELLARGTGAIGEVGEPLLTRLRAVAAATPDAVAVADDGGAVTYSALLERAYALARRLPAGLVGVLADPGIGFVSAILGAWSAGGAYLPLDASMPEARLAALLADSGAEALLVGPGHDELAARIAGNLPSVTLDDAREATGRAVSTEDEALAYVIFTSGSTGKPKGAMVHQRGMVNHLLAKVEDLGLRATDIVVQNAPLTFDVSVWQMLAPLLVGAQVRVVGRTTAADPDALFGLVPAEGVSVLEVVPSLLRVALDAWDIAGAEVALPGLRWLVVTGEALPPDLCVRWFARFPGIPLVNAFGPTECSDDVTHAFLRSGEDCAGVRVPVGRPVRNSRLYVLSDELRPVPSGVPGELYVGGLVVGRGYVNAPERTASVFVADPFGEPGARMYRTGDRVVSRPDGSLEFVERRDFQVKIRGHRIELGEIEAVLAAHPAVGETVVLVRGEKGDQRLVAYVVPAEPVDPAELREHLGGRLPAYMVPHALVVLEKFPLTAHGKVDRKALPAPEEEERRQARGPRTPVEETLCGIYAEVLGLAAVGIDEDFFTLGGHSLLATAVVSRVRSALDAELPVRDLFEARTVARLAERLASAGQARAGFRKLDRPERPPLSFAQSRMWFLNRLDGDGGAYNISLAVRLSGEVEPAALVTAVEDVIARHEILRTTFPDQDGVPYQRILDSGLPLEATTLPETGLTATLSAEAARGFDLAVDRPFRTRLFRLGDEYVLLLVLHHIAGDAWSVDVLARDLATAYQHRLAGRAPGWAELPAQYADYAVWQRELLGDTDRDESVLNRQLDFWRGALAGVPDELALPADLPRTAATAYRGGTVEFDLPPEVHQGLSELALRAGASVFMVLQAAVATLLAKLGAGSDIPLGSLVAGRTDEAVHDLVGFFVNTVVLRTDTGGDPRFTELVERVRDTDLAAYAHQELPFEHLLDTLRPARSLSRQPLFQVMLAHYEVPEAGFDLGGLRVRPEPLPATHAKFKFDLTFQFGERRAGGGLEGTVEYSADLFSAEAAGQLGARLTRLLTAVATDPDRPLSRIDVLTTAERGRVLNQWGGPATGPEADLARLLTGRATATALTGDGISLTYTELRSRVHRLAKALIAAGAGPEKIVTIASAAPVERLIAVLAVLTAGAAYHLPGSSAEVEPFLVLDRELDTAEFSATRPKIQSFPGQAASVTGDGVVLSRGALADVVAGLRDQIRTKDRVCLPDADYAIPAALATFLAGGAVLFGNSGDPTVLLATPTQLKARPGVEGVRVLATGEPLSGALAELVHDHGGSVLNHYGRRETGYFSVAAEPKHGDAVAVLGKPVPGVRAYVLDEGLRPVAPGVRGELYLGGARLARGYLGRTSRTAHRFVADPFGPPGARMFRTGDLVRWRADGTLDFLARAGEEARVRGFAVRPAEIETALAAYPAVAAAAVVVRDDRLLAYLTADGVDLVLLREHLAQVLPDFAVPSAFVVLDALPVTPDGRLDHAALPEPAPQARTGPGTPAEEVLRAAFAETLGLTTVDVDADFFELGGDSLRSVRLVALARKAGLPLTVADVLTHGTVERLAATAGRAEVTGALVEAFAPVLPIRPTGDREPLFCVHAGLGLSLPYLGLARYLDAGRPVYGLQSPNIDEDREFPASVEEVAADYLGRITGIQPEGPYHLLGWSFGGLLVHEIAVQLQAAGHQVALLSILDSYPVDDGTEAVPSERELLTSFLEHVGFDGEQFAGAELTAEDVLEVLRRGDSRLADIGEARMKRVLAVMNNNARLAHRYRPPKFTGGLQLVIATDGLSPEEIAGRASRWAPFTGGAVETHELDCGHEYLMHSAPQGRIGALLAARLDRSTSAEGEL
ncbi:amino acid adenylation domain-containing protein [Amycolatopsis magusensis]|uniref:amino acid adenylation domain-containing protein n=1 Tax=Amycolatopsis magusensis TaxID=882444 RepID=UPI003C2F9E16